MRMSPWAALFIGLLIGERLVELWIARRNRRWMEAQGAVEVGASLTRVIILFHFLWFTGFLFEAGSTGASPLRHPLLPYLVLVFLQAGRYWCVWSLGRYWNTAVLVLPQASPVHKGPYRWLRHPNYLVVGLEILLYPALFGCWRTALAGTLINACLLYNRIRQEEAALRLMRGR